MTLWVHDECFSTDNSFIMIYILLKAEIILKVERNISECETMKGLICFSSAIAGTKHLYSYFHYGKKKVK